MTETTVTDSDIELGVIGTSPGNGHPYSFASIVNGYSAPAFADTDWGGILEYLEAQDSAEFGFQGVRVSHAWTQNPDETEQLCAAARISNAVEDRSALLDVDLDGVLLLRDDYERHWEMAKPFLEAGIPTFVDKPLALDVEAVRAFEPFLRDGTLMSCSGLRYAGELDEVRRDLADKTDVRLIRGTTLNDWERYGIHVLEPILSAVDTRPVAVTATPADHASVRITTADAYPIQFDVLGDAPVTFDVDIYTREWTSHRELTDNFRAFRRTLWHFIQGIRTGDPPIDPEATLGVVRVLVAGQRALADGSRVELADLDI